jgi:hypothetical protein
MGVALRKMVAARYEATQCTAEYQRLFARARELKRPWRRGGRLSYASRLDQPWIPNALVKAVRSTLRRHAGTNGS